jgi:hypothetical protein
LPCRICGLLWRIDAPLLEKQKRPTVVGTLELEEERDMRATKDAPNEQKRKVAGQKVSKGWIEKTGRK